CPVPGAFDFTNAAQAIGEPAPQNQGSAENFIVTGLKTGTTYCFALKSADEAPNVSGISNVVAATTQDGPTQFILGIRKQIQNAGATPIALTTNNTIAGAI